MRAKAFEPALGATTESHSGETRGIEPRAIEPRGVERTGDTRAVGSGHVVVPLGGGRAVHVHPTPAGTRLCVRGEREQELNIEVRFEASGPVVHVRAQKLELDGIQELAAGCDRFAVHAREQIELSSGGGLALRAGGDLTQDAQGQLELRGRNVGVEARPGSVRLKANDDVQLLGEQILLNCDREPPLPRWVQRAAVQPAPTLPPEQHAGDPDLLAALLASPAASERAK